MTSKYEFVPPRHQPPTRLTKSSVIPAITATGVFWLSAVAIGPPLRWLQTQAKLWGPCATLAQQKQFCR